jgi:hypothetical protein
MSKVQEIMDVVSKALTGKSQMLGASENQNTDYRAGYAVGMTASGDAGCQEWVDAWLEYGELDCEEWQSWKRGFHAGKSSLL